MSFSPDPNEYDQPAPVPPAAAPVTPDEAEVTPAPPVEAPVAAE